MNSDDLYLHFRNKVNDRTVPYMWSEVEVYGFIDEAQKLFCRNTMGIADSQTPEICEVAVTAGSEFAEISPKILKLRSVRLDSDPRRAIEILNFEDLEAPRVTSDYGVRLSSGFNWDRQGRIDAVVVGMDPYSLRLVGIPTADETLKLIVYRLPIATIAAGKGVPQVLEIGEEYHRDLVWGMMAIAYGQQDSQTYDRTKMVECQDRFLALCAKARDEKNMREHKYRSVGYGGL